MSARINKSRFALLGILSLGPHSGYDIKQFVDQVLSYFWAESYGQIYPLLKQLAKEGLVRKRTTRQSGRPDRNLYSLTAAGRRELQHWLAQPPSPPPVRNELLLKMFFGNLVTPDILIRHVQASRAAAEEMLEILKQAEVDMGDQVTDPLQHQLWKVTLRLGLRITRARLLWCQETLSTLRTLKPEDNS